MRTKKELLEMELAKAELRLVDEALRLLVNPTLGFEAEFKIELNEAIPKELQEKILFRLNEVINQEFTKELKNVLDSTGQRILAPIIGQNMSVHESFRLDSIIELRKVYSGLLDAAKHYALTTHKLAISSIDEAFQRAEISPDQDAFYQDENFIHEEIN